MMADNHIGDGHFIPPVLAMNLARISIDSISTDFIDDKSTQA